MCGNAVLMVATRSWKAAIYFPFRELVDRIRDNTEIDVTFFYGGVTHHDFRCGGSDSEFSGGESISS